MRFQAIGVMRGRMRRNFVEAGHMKAPQATRTTCQSSLELRLKRRFQVSESSSTASSPFCFSVGVPADFGE